LAEGAVTRCHGERAYPTHGDGRAVASSACGRSPPSVQMRTPLWWPPHAPPAPSCSRRSATRCSLSAATSSLRRARRLRLSRCQGMSAPHALTGPTRLRGDVGSSRPLMRATTRHASAWLARSVRANAARTVTVILRADARWRRPAADRGRRRVHVSLVGGASAPRFGRADQRHPAQSRSATGARSSSGSSDASLRFLPASARLRPIIPAPPLGEPPPGRTAPARARERQRSLPARPHRPPRPQQVLPAWPPTRATARQCRSRTAIRI